jgi:hypothetical protein
MSRAVTRSAVPTTIRQGQRLIAAVPHSLNVAAIALLVVMAFAAVRLAGGSPTSLNHLGYVPILLAAYLYNWRGGLVASMVVAFVLGPAANIMSLGGTVEGVEAWLTRGIFFVGIGGLVGALFQQARLAVDSWRSTALKVIDREREGMTALARGLAAKDGHTGDHVTRVQSLTQDLALAAGFSQPEARDIGWSAMLHDLGKLHVPDAILLKPGPLTSAEWNIIRQHPLWGEEILAHGDGFEMARRIARWHHENFDGSGYPDALRHDRIPLEARLVRITDTFDAMTHRRPYHAPRAFEYAVEELRRCAGRQFDPELVELFLELALAGRIETINEELASGATPTTGAPPAD